MSEASDASAISLNIYEEDINEETALDLSSKDLETLPDIKNKYLCVLYLQNNKLTTLPDDFFTLLPCLMYLDLRDNRLTDIPKSIKNHQGLTHLLLQNNCLTSLPNELGTVSLKVLQLNGNPLMYPPREVINAGTMELLKFLNDKYIDHMFALSQSDVSETEHEKEISQESISYNSVTDLKNKGNNLSIKLNEKEVDSDEEQYPKFKGKCPKLARSRYKNLPTYYQSCKYLKPLYADSKKEREEKIKQAYLKDKAITKHKDLLATRERILQERKNFELLKNWRQNYRHLQFFARDDYKMDPKSFPYDTNPEYMTFLTREDIEKDLPDKYRRSILRRSKPSMPRKSNNDVHLAMKIKKLFENLEKIDLNREGLTPRTEQKVLLNEIQKISEIKQKLMELSTANMRSLSGKE